MPIRDAQTAQCAAFREAVQQFAVLFEATSPYRRASLLRIWRVYLRGIAPRGRRAAAAAGKARQRLLPTTDGALAVVLGWTFARRPWLDDDRRLLGPTPLATRGQP